MKVGDKFGRWEVVETSGTNWSGRSLCKCECGTTRKVHNQNLTIGKSKSCGCKVKDDGRQLGLRIQRSIEPTHLTKDNSTGYKGVIEVGNHYQVRLAVGGFASPKEAHECYVFLKEKAREFQDEAFS